MYLRQITANLLRKTRISSQNVSSSHFRAIVNNALPFSVSTKAKYFYKDGTGSYYWRMKYNDSHLWTILVGQAAVFLGANVNAALADAPTESTPENDSDIVGLRKIEDGSVISNIHTSKWRVFTDSGRDFFLQGKFDKAETLFLSALQEAKEGFGERDPHVASACNNLAELYRVQKVFDKAEPLYLEAVNILEESLGPEDIRVGTAMHNLGQFYLVQRKLEEARKCYERALKIKGRILGYSHIDYADTMYHLGTVLYLLRKEDDAEALIQDSIRILEEGGQGESIMCVRRLRYLAQIYLKSNQLVKAENVQRKVLHIMELSKGWNSIDTVVEAERLALTLQSIGILEEAQELLERCLDARKTLLPEDHIQISANMLHIARVVMLNSNRLTKMNASEAMAELDRAKDLLYSSTGIARKVLSKFRRGKSNMQKNVSSEREERAALIILLQSLDALGLLEMRKQELQDSKEDSPNIEAEKALSQCISAYKEFEAERFISDSTEVKVEYVSCLKHLQNLISDSSFRDREPSRGSNLQELSDEIKRVETEISRHRKRKS